MGGKLFYDKIPTKCPRHVYIKVDRFVGHSGGGPSVPSNKVIRDVVLQEYRAGIIYHSLEQLLFMR